jgi:hypothetical protein
VCDYHSVLVDGAGRIYHNATNSHREIRDTLIPDERMVWEAEANPHHGGSIADYQLIRRRGQVDPPSVAQRAVERHYEALFRLHGGDLSTFLTGPWTSAGYSDVRQNLAAGFDDALRAAVYPGGFDVDGFNPEGRDIRGYDIRGMDSDGYDVDGYDTDGYNVDGFDCEGYDNDGYNGAGLHIDCLDSIFPQLDNAEPRSILD